MGRTSASFLGTTLTRLFQVSSQSPTPRLPPPVAAPQMSHLAWGFISNSSCLFVLVLSGASSGPRGRAWGLWLPEMPPASVGARDGKCALPPGRVPHATPRARGRTHPRGALRRHATPGHPSCPAACDEVTGWGPGDPLQIGRGLPQLVWEWLERTRRRRC